MDNVELKVMDVDKDIIRFIDEGRYTFLRIKKADKLILAIKNEIVVGDVAIYYTDFCENIAMIGMMHCDDKNVGSLLLKTAVEKLQEVGSFKIVAPIDRDTWSDYRVKESSLLKNPQTTSI